MKRTLHAASLALAITMVSGTLAGPIVLNANTGFETGTPSWGPVPFAIGAWDFDRHSFVGPTAGITPAAGNQMLRFDATSPNGAGTLTTCDVVQIIDLVPFVGLLNSSSGSFAIEGSALVNRVPNAPADFDFSFQLTLYSFSNVTNATNLNFATASVSASIVSDANPQTWELLSAVLNAPLNTTHIGVLIRPFENPASNDTTFPEFAGHFADEVIVTACACDCDYNMDGICDGADITDLANDIASGTTTPASDFNCDGVPDHQDVIDLANVISTGSC